MSPAARPGPDDLRRTFDAVPARTPDAHAPFADSWWGRAWVDALETLSMDEGRLARGRVYADGGHVAAVTVTPGRVIAYVHGSRPRPYRAELRLRTFTASDWDTFLDAVAARPGHLSALLDKEMPHSLVDTAGETGIRLLPAAGDLDPDCSCPDRGWPCKHVAALCFQTARLLDSDPFVLLLMRGRGSANSWTNSAAATPSTPPASGPPPPPYRRWRPRRPSPTGTCPRSPRRCPCPRTPARHRPTRSCPAPATRSDSTTSPPTRRPAPTPS